MDFWAIEGSVCAVGLTITVLLKVIFRENLTFKEAVPGLILGILSSTLAIRQLVQHSSAENGSLNGLMIWLTLWTVSTFGRKISEKARAKIARDRAASAHNTPS